MISRCVWGVIIYDPETKISPAGMVSPAVMTIIIIYHLVRYKYMCKSILVGKPFAWS
jgi:hypothetical protein